MRVQWQTHETQMPRASTYKARAGYYRQRNVAHQKLTPTETCKLSYIRTNVLDYKLTNIYGRMTTSFGFPSKTLKATTAISRLTSSFRLIR